MTITWEINLEELSNEELLEIKEIAEKIRNYNVVDEINEFIYLQE